MPLGQGVPRLLRQEAADRIQGRGGGAKVGAYYISFPYRQMMQWGVSYR